MKRQRYGVTEDGQALDVITLASAEGMRVRILTLGCIIAGLEVPDRQGRFANVVLGLDSVSDYMHRSPHFGAIEGRYANPIARGRFAIDGIEYRLVTNAGPNALHGVRRRGAAPNGGHMPSREPRQRLCRPFGRSTAAIRRSRDGDAVG